MDLDSPNTTASEAVCPTVLGDLRQYGDRTSSFLTSYPGFLSFRADGQCVDAAGDALTGQIRYMAARRAWIAATEPIAAPEVRSELFKRFAEAARADGRRAVQVPVTKPLARELDAKGFHSIQIGSEGVFDLEEYFSRPEDPLALFPISRSLAKRGVKIVELDADALPPKIEFQLHDLTDKWLKGKGANPMGFLNQVAPLHLKEHKKIFALVKMSKATSGKKGGDRARTDGSIEDSEILAFLSAVPIFATRSYFFADYIRAPQSKSGSVELLFIEAMRMLRAEGCREVRLGLCPFARIDASEARNGRERRLCKLMDLAFRYSRFPLNMQTIYEFKAKFAPTRWEPLYLVACRKIRLRTLNDVMEVHLGGSPARCWMRTQAKKIRAQFRKPAALLPLPRTWPELARRSSLTLSIFTFLAGLHLARVYSPATEAAFAATGYSPGQLGLLAALVGPLFHNNAFHLSGDLLSFVFFGAIVETLKGRRVFLTVLALGLWATNPLTHALVAAFLPAHDPAAWTSFLTERDYGSSNAIYAFVGLLAALMRQPHLLLMPFLANGLFLCFSTGSYLSLHHLVGLALGYVAGQVCLRAHAHTQRR